MDHLILNNGSDSAALAEVALKALREARNSKTSNSGSIFVSDGQTDDNGIALGTGTIINGVDGGIQPWVGDTTPPGKPTGLSVSSKNAAVFVNWDGSMEGGKPLDWGHLQLLATDDKGNNYDFGVLYGAGSQQLADLTPGAKLTVWAIGYDDAHDAQGNSTPNASTPSDSLTVTVESAVSAAEVQAIQSDLSKAQSDIAEAEASMTDLTRTVSTVDGKATTSGSAPTASDASGKPEGAMWYVMDASGDMTGTYVLKSGAWVKYTWASSSIADEVNQSISDAQSGAQNALNQAGQAKSTADTAAQTAQGAQADAKNAVTTANSANDTSTHASSTAQQALAAAQSAQKDTVTQWVPQYAVNESTTDAPTTGWSVDKPSWTAGHYIWLRTVVGYGSGDYTYSNPVLLTGNPGATGPKGDPGSRGPAGADGKDGTSVKIKGSVASASQLPSSAMVGDGYLTDDTGHLYVWGDSGWTDVGVIRGPNGVSAYVHTAWADSSDGKTDFSLTDGGTRTYMGVYADNVAADSTNPGDYTWTKIVGPQGPNGLNGSNGVSVTAITPYWALGTSAPAQPAVATPPSPWQSTEPGYSRNQHLYKTSKVTYDNGQFAYMPVVMDSSYEYSAAAESSARDAVQTATNANTTAQTAKSTADSAVSTANAASSTASTAKSTADGASSVATQANATAVSANQSATSAQTAANLALANAQELIRNPTMRSDVDNPDGWPGNVTLGSSGAPSNPPTPFTTYAKVTGRDHLTSWTLPNIPGRVFQYIIYAVADSTAAQAMSFGVQYSDSNGTMHWTPAISVSVAQGQAGWARYVGTFTVPDNTGNTNLPIPWLQIDTYASDSGWYVTGLSIKDITEAQAAQKAADDAQSTADTANTTAQNATTIANAAKAAAQGAQTTADGKNKIFSSASEPSHTGIVPGDMWFQLDSDKNVSGIQVWNGSAFTDMVLLANKLLVASSVGTTQIADNAITTGKITANAVNADKIAANTITAASGIIADAAITNAKIASLDAGKITSGYVDAARIAAGSITADKLLVGGGSDYSPNPTFDPSGPLLGTPHSWIPCNGGHSVRLTGRDNVFPASTAFPVANGDMFYITCEAAHPDGTAPLSLGLWWTVEPSTATSIPCYQNFTLATDLGKTANDWNWHKYSATISVPTASDAVVTAARGYIQMEVGNTGEETIAENTWLIGNYHIYKVSDGTLIADGSISTNKLVSQAVTADKIAANAITAIKIAAQTITGDKLDVGSVAAAIVTSGKFQTATGSDRTEMNNTGVTVYKGGKAYTHLGSDTQYGLQVWNPFTSRMNELSPVIFGAKSALEKTDITSDKFDITATGTQYGPWKNCPIQKDADGSNSVCVSATGRFVVFLAGTYTAYPWPSDFVMVTLHINFVKAGTTGPIVASSSIAATGQPPYNGDQSIGIQMISPSQEIFQLTPNQPYNYFFSFIGMHIGKGIKGACSHCNYRSAIIMPV